MNQPHTQQPQQAVSALQSSSELGLTGQEATARLDRYGKNSLVVENPIRFLGILREELTEPMILLLLYIGIIYSVLGVVTGDGLLDAATIIVVIILFGVS